MDENQMGWLSSLSEEELFNLFQPFEQKGALLESQLMQAQALQRPTAQHHSTGMGAALGGIGNAVRSWGGAFTEHGLPGGDGGLRGQQSANLAGMQSDASGRTRSMIDFLRQRRTQQTGNMADAGQLPPGMV